eukprot:1374860-Amphidinium_carterae.1
MDKLSVDLVKQILSSLELGKACGADGLRDIELAAMDDAGIAGLTALLCRIEELGSWPTGLQVQKVVFLPKPGKRPQPG